jgi:hypothetical protein
MKNQSYNVGANHNKRPTNTAFAASLPENFNFADKSTTVDSAPITTSPGTKKATSKTRNRPDKSNIFCASSNSANSVRVNDLFLIGGKKPRLGQALDRHDAKSWSFFVSLLTRSASQLFDLPECVSYDFSNTFPSSAKTTPETSIFFVRKLGQWLLSWS